jgi:hypothetical protein
VEEKREGTERRGTEEWAEGMGRQTMRGREEKGCREDGHLEVEGGCGVVLLE